MSGLNHALSGGLIALTTPAVIAIPLAFVSHFILDMIPHYGIPHNKRNKSTRWKTVAIFDFILTFTLAVIVIINRPEFLLIICPLLATSPDYFWVAKVARSGSYNFKDTTNRFSKWHMHIQNEYSWGIWVELVFAIVLSYLVFIVYW